MRFILAIATLSLAASAQAASFDCARARQPDERAICASRLLNDRDVQMRLLYDLDKGFMAMGSRDAMQDDQAAWLARRRGCGADRACLLRRYDERIAVLRGFIDSRVKTQGPF